MLSDDDILKLAQGHLLNFCKYKYDIRGFEKWDYINTLYILIKKAVGKIPDNVENPLGFVVWKTKMLWISFRDLYLARQEFYLTESYKKAYCVGDKYDIVRKIREYNFETDEYVWDSIYGRYVCEDDLLTKIDLDKIYEKLTPKEKDVFNLIPDFPGYYEKCKMAKVLGVSAAAIRQRLQNIRKKVLRYFRL